MNIVKVITRLEGMPMKSFRTLEQAKRDLQVYLDYINLISTRLRALFSAFFKKTSIKHHTIE